MLIKKKKIISLLFFESMAKNIGTDLCRQVANEVDMNSECSLQIDFFPAYAASPRPLLWLNKSIQLSILMF